MCSKNEFCDWMRYEKKYWCTAPGEPGVLETRDASTKEKLFITGTEGGSLLKSLERKDPKLRPGTPSGYEKQLVNSGGKLEVRYAVTDSVGKAIDLRNFLLHKHIEKHRRLPLGQIRTPRLCPRGRSGGCTICKE